MTTDLVAVTGIGCRAPGARDHRQFFDNLWRGVSSIREVDPERWDPAEFYSPDISAPNKTVSKWCGQIDQPYAFDNDFFRTPPKAARLMDPQQRLLLEETWHCIEDSGTPLTTLQQARCEVFVGVASRDHLQQGNQPGITVESHTAFGGSDYMLANRLSHSFGLTGQSMAIDAACASSLVSIHLGIRGLLAGQADFVLAGGVLVNLHPWKFISYSKARMLSPTGLCRTFDKDADGFVPGDGAVMVMLRRLDDALRDGDHVYGLLAGSAVNHTGAGRTITAPSVAAQQDVVAAAFDRAGFDPATVGYVEAHGTGTAMGDPIEVEALHRLMSAAPRIDGGCWIGSVKANIGHLEAAAGAAGLVKVLMMMAHRRIPPSVHLHAVNPLIAVDDGVLRLARRGTEWNAAPGRPLRAGVSSFGAGGVNAHLCVQEYQPEPEPAAPGGTTPQPFLLSAASPRSLELLLARWREGLATDGGWIRGSVVDICATLATGRRHLGVRTGALVSSLDDIAALVADAPSALAEDGRGDGPPQTELHVGELVPPPRDRLVAMLDSPLFAGLEPGPVESIRAGVNEPGQRYLFTYLVLRALRQLGLQPTTTIGHGPGRWAALAATGAIDWSGGLALAGGAIADAPLRAPEVPVRHTGTGLTVYPYLVDEEYVGELLAASQVDDEVVRAVCRRAGRIIDGQWVVRRAVEEWNRLLDQRGLRGWQVPTDEAGLNEHAVASATATLVCVLALENAFDQLSRTWDLSLDRLVQDARVTELLDLLADGLLTADGVLGLLVGDPDERASIVDRLQRSILRLGRGGAGRFPLLRERSRMPAGLDRAAGWATTSVAGGRPATGAVAVAVGTVPGISDGTDCLTITESDVADHLAAPLLTLWRRGLSVDWDRFYAGRGARKVPLPTTEFVRTVHRQVADPPIAAAVRPDGPRLVELDETWVPDPGHPLLVTEPSALVVAPAEVLDRVRVAAEAALPGYRLAFTGIGDRFRQDGPGRWTVRAEEDDWNRLFADLIERNLRPRYAIRIAGPAGPDPAHRIEVPALIALMLGQQLLRLRDGAPALLLDVVGPGGPADAGAALGRSLRWESGTVRLRSVSLDTGPADMRTWRRIAQECRLTGEDVVRYVGGTRCSRRFTVRDIEPAGAGGPRPGGVYLVTGGRGALGQAVAAHLIATPGTRVALAGRSPMTAEQGRRLAALLGSVDDRIAYFRADVCDPESTRRLVAEVRQRFGPINGVVHAAGVLRDGYLLNKTSADLEAVLAPKVRGAANLDAALSDEPLDFFALFSSLAAVTGNPGQTDYAVANALMEAFAAEREGRREEGSRRGRTVAVGWPLWDLAGMASTAGADTVYQGENGFVPLPASIGLTALDAALRGEPGRRLFLYGDPQRALPLCHGGSDALAPEPSAPPVDQPGQPWAPRYLSTLFAELLGVPEEQVDPTRGLDSYGLDSIHVRTFNARVEHDLGPIPHTLLFECRTLAQVAAALAVRFPGAVPPPDNAGGVRVHDRAEPGEDCRVDEPTGQQETKAPARPRPGADREPVAIIGVAGRYPQAPDLDVFWRNLAAGRDCVTEIPASRWDYRERYAEKPEDGTYCKWGGFLEGVDRFDPIFFNIAPRDAELIDPQERLFLQAAWHALEDAGYPPARLGSPDVPGERAVGVFVGVTTQSYLLWGPDQWRLGNMVVPTSTLWSIPNRVSYCLDLHGPSMPVDTACASSLTALHLACASLAAGECRVALVGAVNLYLHPSKYDWLCQMRMLSRTGHCHTFGAGADGFVPGEGVGAVVLKPLADAERDGDRVLGVVRGTAVNHGGRTSGFTVPNPNAQAELVSNALRRAGAGDGIDYLEAHGTGTALGDPIEIAGLRLALGRLGTGPGGGCPIGSVKTNIGHLEAAAGLAGLTKVLLQMRHRQLVPSLHSDPANPSIDFAGTPLRVQRDLAPWRRRRAPDGTQLPLRAGISAFGAGGANAHAVIEEYLGPQPAPVMVPGEQVAVVSAKDAERLRAHCRNLAAALRGRSDDVGLAEVVYQLQVRREPLSERVALLVGTVDALADALDALADGREPAVPYWSRTGRREAEGGQDELAALARSWASGAEVRWETRYPRPLRHVPLPGYPFAEESYWVPDAEPSTRAHPFLAADGISAARFTGMEYFLEDHRVHGERIFPAVGYLEMVRAAAVAAGHPVRALSGNVWASAVTVPGPTTVHVELSDDRRGARYAVYSHDATGTRLVHGRGRVDTATPAAGGTLDIAGVRERCRHRLPGADYYPWLRSLGLQLGPAYQGVQELRWGDGELLSEYRLPAAATAGAGPFVLNPCTLDSAIQGALWLLHENDGLEHLHLPFTMGSCELFGPTPGHGFAHVVIRAVGEKGHKLDIDVADTAGTVLVRIRDFWLRRWQSGQDEAPAGPGTFLRPEWVIDTLPAGTAGQRAASDTLVLAPSPAAGRLLVGELARTGAGPATVVLPGADVTAAVGDQAAGDGPRRVVFAWPGSTFTGTAASAAAQVRDGLLPLFDLVRAVLAAPGKAPVELVCAYPAPDAGAPGYEALGGFLRTVGRESPRFAHRLVELSEPEFAELIEGAGPAAERLAAELRALPGTGCDVRYRSGARQVRSWRRSSPLPVARPAGLRSGGAYLISGGSGALAAQVSRWLAETAAARIVLAGRSPLDAATEATLLRIHQAGGEARYVQADVSTAAGAEAAVHAVRDSFGELHGVVHAAGVLRDGFLSQLDATSLMAVLAPKVNGAAHLDAVTTGQPLDFFCLFASLAGPIGSVGQAGYAYANGFLDAFAQWREHQRAAGLRAGRTIAIDWPLWADGGMSVDEEVRESLRRQFGVVPLGTADGLGALASILDHVTGQVAYVPGDGRVLLARLGADTRIPDAAPAPLPTGRPEPQLLELLTRIVAGIVKLDPARVVPSEPIGSYGFDSLAFSRLANELNEALDLDITPATFFEYTTVSDLAAHLLEIDGTRLAARSAQSFAEPGAAAPMAPVPAPEIPAPEIPAAEIPAAESPVTDAAAPGGDPTARAGGMAPTESAVGAAPTAPARSASGPGEPIAIIGMSGMLPGSRDLSEFWAHLDRGDDLVTEVPAQRWDWRDYYSATPGEPNRTNSKWGGFLPEVDRFDARFFGVSPREAELMDPQQRLFLETVYRTIEDAGYAPAELGAGHTGLFVGVASHDYYDLQRDAGLSVEAYTTTGYFHSILANRISYLLGLTGPSLPIDTACSSSLVAIRSAIESIWAGSSDVAIAGGINLLISPMIYISFSRAGMLSPTGRCRTFDKGADGYVRGEGAGAVLLKPLSRALRDGDHVHAVIRGSAINHGGKVNTLTTPNPNAQAELIVSAFEEAAVDPVTVGYMEMHGTGTALGDPIEVNGLKKAFRELRRRGGRSESTTPGTVIGSVKSNIGHLEAAAGMAGLFKVILAMRHGRIPGNLHIDEVNPHIQLDGTPLRIARAPEAWPRRIGDTGLELPRRAGVSSFGFGGINAHLLVEEHIPADHPVADAIGEHLLVLSARTPEQLADRARDLAAFLEAGCHDASAGTGLEADLAAFAAGMLGMPTVELPSGETMEDLGIDGAGLRDLQNRIADRYATAARLQVLPTDTLATVAARIPVPGRGAHLRDIAYTLQVGREPMAHRLALVTESAGAAANALRRFAQTGAVPSRGCAGVATLAGKASAAPPSADLTRLADHWAGGGAVDWGSLYPGDRPRRVCLPTYPFARVRHWIAGAAADPGTRSRPRPWIAFDERAGDPGSAVVYRARLRAGDPVVREHRVGGEAVLPGVGHLELVLTAVADVLPEATRLTRVVWLRPLTVPDDGRDVLVSLRRRDAAVDYEVRARFGDEIVTCSQGTVQAVPGAPGSAPRRSLDELRGRCPQVRDPGSLYASFRASGIEYGPFFQGLREVRVGEGEVVALAEAAASGTGFTLHPTLLDSALQAIAALDGEGVAPARLPFALESVHRYGPLPGRCHIHVRANDAGGYDVELLDEDGRVLVAIADLSVRPAPARTDPLPLYVPYWAEQSPTPPASPAGRGTCLIVHPARHFGLAGGIGAAWPADRVRTLQLDGGAVGAGAVAALARRLRDLGPVEHVWFLGGLRESADGDPDPAPALFVLVKALAEADLMQTVGTLRVLINGVQDVAGRRTTNPAAGALIGFLSAVGKEYPRVATCCVDIGVTVGGTLADPDRAALVRAVLAEPPSVDEVALVNGRRYVKRLRPIELPTPARPVFRDGGTYLVVGGASGIGQAVARHLAGTRRARLVLVGRRPADAQIEALVTELSQLGAESVYRDGDVTDPVRLAAIMTEARERFGRIHGVVNAAMVLRDGIVERMDAAAFEEVLSPKARGTEVLGDLLRGERLDFLLHLSSVQSFTGSAGQANYAAASTAQDAHARRSAGRGAFPVKVINWGPWGDVGRVASASYRRSVIARGFHPIGTAAGLEALERVLAGDESQVVAIRADAEALAAIGVIDAPAIVHRAVVGAAPMPVGETAERQQAAAEDYTAHALLRALRAAGLFPHPGAGHADLWAALGALPEHRPLVRALAGILVGHGLVACHGGQYVLLDRAIAGGAADGPRVRAEFPGVAARLDLVDTCLAGLVDVLTGVAAATEVLFPGGSTDLLARVYRDEPVAAYCNLIVAEQVAAAAAERSRPPTVGPVRVLEIGAGTGGTTAAVLDALRGRDVPVSYDVTDLSEALLRQTRRSLVTTGPVSVDFRRLDISERPVTQGFTPGSYDVVVAGNVLHAVADLGAALANTRELLVPGGRLVLTEVTQVQAFHTVTFGLLAGWWPSPDEADRLESAPLLDVPMWRRRLEHTGYVDIAAVGSATVPAAVSQRVIVADVPIDTTASAPAPEAAERWLHRLISELTARTIGMSVQDVTPDEPLSALGVDSIVGVELINRLNTELDITLKTIVIFDHPTVADLARFIHGRHGEAVAARIATEQPAPAPAPAQSPAQTPTPTAVRTVAPMPTKVRTPTPAAPAEFRAVRFSRPGSPRQLTVVPIEPAAPGRGEVEIQVKAFPINFSDLLLAKGLYPIMPDYPFTPGVEVSGVVRRVGPGVCTIRPGDEVVALTRLEMGGQASVVLTDEDFVVPKPANVSHEQACGFPAAFLAMHLAFEWAQLRAGERILVPAATGTNALIAVQLAQLAGAEVVATAGSPAKVDFLAGIGVPGAIDHERTDVVQEVLARTGGRGVDVVVNTLGGRAIQQGLSVLAPEGRYVEVAVFGLQSSGPLDLSRMVDNQRFYSLNAKKYFLQHPERRAEHLRIMAAHLESGDVKPFVAHVLPFDRILDAYALKEDRATVGRVVVTVPDPAPSPPSQPSQPSAPSAPSARPVDDRPAIAIIGMAARLPGARDVDELWANLAAGVSSISEVPAGRWSDPRFFDPDPTNLGATYCRWGGFLDDVDRFDAPFFGISGKEAEQMDPQQRVFLEEAWRALEDAGYTGRRLAGRACGVFVGAGASEYLVRMNKAGAVKQAQAFWGNEASILAARISYFLDLKGPSIAVNTACSSSLVALHLACQSLLAGETSMALAGGAFLTLAPDYFVVASNGNMLSPQGRCKTFDASADGFGPGEGVGVLVLKPLDAALRDGDQVHGVIRASAVNQDGRTNGITAPSGLAQTDVELAAYRRAGIDPSTITCVEAHGTGTPLGDPIEVEALTNAFREYTGRTGFCAIGSVKTNIGHTAAAAGVAGVIKVLLSFRHRQLPPSLNFTDPNPLIDFANTPFYVNTELRDWATEPPLPRRAAVSGFGFSGTNAHVVLEEPPHRERSVPAPRPTVAVPVSAHTRTALDARLDRLAAWLDGPGEDFSLAEIGYNLQVFRDHQAVRAVFVARDRSDLARQLRDRAPLGAVNTELASRYLAGEDVDWSASWPGQTCDRIPLPGYEFDRHRYWFTGTDTDTVYGDGNVRAIRFRTMDDGDAMTARTTLTGQEFYLRDHVVDGRTVLPGVAYPEFARSAANGVGLPGGEIRDLHWVRALEVNGSPVDLTVRFEVAAGGHAFEFRSGPDVVHARGILLPPPTPPRVPGRWDLGALAAQCTRTVPVADYYTRLRALGLVHGPALACIQDIRVGDGVVLARLRLPASAGSAAAFDLHPSLLDGALQTLGALDWPPEELLLPKSVAAVTHSGVLPSECFVTVTAVPGRMVQPGRIFDIRLLDDDGRELAALHHLTLGRANGRRPAPDEPTSALHALLHRLRSGQISEAEAETAMEASLAH